MNESKPHSDPANKPTHGKDEKTSGLDLDPRAELGLKRPSKDANDDKKTQLNRQEAEKQKATQFDGNPNPEGASVSTFGPKDDTPMKLEKVKGPRNDQ